MFIKVGTRRDNTKPFDKLSFLEQLNDKRDDRANAFKLNALEHDVGPFPLDLFSPCLMIATNQLMLKYPKDFRLHAHLIKCGY